MQVKSNAVKLLSLVFILSFSFTMVGQAQQQAGAAESTDKSNQKLLQKGVNPFQTATALDQDDSKFHTTVFTFTDIVVFAYANDTEITVVNSVGDTTLNMTLQKDEYHSASFSPGVYRIFGSKSFTTLVGDATSDRVHGWYAVDQSGRGTATLFNTYMMQEWSGEEEFIISAYENNTEFTVRNSNTGDLIYAGVLNEDEQFALPQTPYDTYLQVSASKPVSALSYGDQDYYVPAENGSFSGQELLGYSAHIGDWTNSITVTGYHDNTEVTVLNTTTGDTINTYTLDEGQVHSDPINEPTYWKVEASKTVTAGNIPYAGWTGNYSYMTRAVDKSGVGSGKLFYLPTIASQVNVFSFEDANDVKIERLGENTSYPYSDTTMVFEGTLDSGEGYTFDSSSGRYVYKITGSENLSVIQSNNTAGAEFMPLSFAQELPDIAVSSDGISFDPDKDDYTEGEEVNVTVDVNNYGPIDASEVKVEIYQGDPDGEGAAPLLYETTIPMLEGESSSTVSFDYTIPSEPGFRRLVVKADPENTIEESNNDNNKASKSIEPNKDLLPPLAVTVDVPGGLSLNENDELEPNPFTVEATFLNTGDVDAQGVSIDFETYDGLAVVEGQETQSVDPIAPNDQITLSWQVEATVSDFGANRFQIQVDGDNLEGKNVNRAVNIPLISPNNVQITEGEEDGIIELSWDEHMSENISGFKIYRGSSLESLVEIASLDPGTLSYTDEDLPQGTFMYVVTAFADDNVESDWSNILAYHHRSVTEDWQLISYPMTEQTVALESSQAFGFDGTYTRSDELQSKKGYWLKSRDEETIGLIGDPMYSTSIDLKEGWNLIGTVADSVDPSQIKDPGGILTETPIYKYSEGTYSEASWLSPDMGYWLYADANGSIDIVTEPSMNSESSTPDQSDQSKQTLSDQISRIVFSSGEAEQSFYMTSSVLSSRNQYQYMLPPKAPEPKLDVRTESGYTISDDKVTTIKLTADSYPVKVSVPEAKNMMRDVYRLIVYEDGNERFIDLVPGKGGTISKGYDKLVLKRLKESEEKVENRMTDNYPNPFNPTTSITYTVANTSDVTMNVYNVLGQKVRTLVNERKQPGKYQVRFDGSNLASGVYYLRLQIGQFSKLQKMTLIK